MKKHNLKEGKDELIRAILLMKYDTKKTLSENQEIIKPLIKEDVPGVTVASGAIGAGAGVGAAALGAGTLAGGSVGTTAMAVGAALGAAPGTGAALAIGSSVLGAAVGLAIVPLAYWLITKDTGSERVRKYFEFCSTSSDKVKKLSRKLSDSEIRNLSDAIYDSIEGVGTDEDSLFNSFKQLSNGSASDVCALLKYYNSQYGDLWDDLDSDIDSESEWNQIYRPIRNCVEESLLEIKEDIKECPKEKPYYNLEKNECQSLKCGGCVPFYCPDGTQIPSNGKCLGQSNPDDSKWKDCSTFPLFKGCKSKLVADVQKCIGASPDGKFGSKTELKLKDKGYNTTIDKTVYDEIMKNCNQGNVNTTTTTTYRYDGDYTYNDEINK